MKASFRAVVAGLMHWLIAAIIAFVIALGVMAVYDRASRDAIEEIHLKIDQHIAGTRECK